MNHSVNHRSFFRPAFREISPVDAASRLSDFVLIDVREPFERSGELGSISGSHNVPLSQLLATGLPARFEPHRPVLIICRSGGRSSQAAMALARRGHPHVFNLTGGMIAWNRAGLAVTRTPRSDAAVRAPVSGG